MSAVAAARGRLQVLSDAQEPVSDYKAALWRLFEYSHEAGIDDDLAPMPWAIQFVADVFWIEPERVRSDLHKLRAVV